MRKRRCYKKGGWSTAFAISLVMAILLASSGCFTSEEVQLYYGRVVVPRKQEFRWSDGGLPQVFDPALAAVPPDTDVVRAMFEGLTAYDPRSLTPVSAVAARWEASPGNRQWTFYLRRDARWSNGDPVTARDFVNSWQRTIRLGDRAPHARLLENIEGIQSSVAPRSDAAQADERIDAKAKTKESPKESPEPPTKAPAFGAEAVGNYILRVHLKRPDKNFPALVAHPVFSPVHEMNTTSDADFPTPSSLSADATPTPQVVSNGAFRLLGLASHGVVLERAKNYWNAETVELERVRFVATRNTEAALNAYRAGEVDAVTNVTLEPLALKLLAPYKDFQRTTYGAITYYTFNTTHSPFDDLRVREALTIALDRDRLSTDVMQGATEPAQRFLPAQVINEGSGGEQTTAPIERDVERARRLMIEAGFPGGMGFPRIQLLINRNDQHRMLAEAVATMWRNVLGVETDVIIRSWDEYEVALRNGDYDVARRSMVMQTTDEETNMLAMFGPDMMKPNEGAEANKERKAEATNTPVATSNPEQSDKNQTAEKPVRQNILTEAQALKELPAMPVYFASSYALVKPYVVGFDANLLDVRALKRVRIDTSWQPPKQESQSRIERKQ